MNTVKAVIVGYGDIGKAVYEVFSPSIDIATYDLKQGMELVEYETDVLMICIPYSETFVDIVQGYQEFYKPKDFTVVFSTTQIGTCRQLKNTVHVPIEGRHPALANYLEHMHYIIGCNNGRIGTKAMTLFSFCGLAVKSLAQNTDHTEAAKLLSTLNYGVNIEFARMAKALCDEHKLEYSVITGYNNSYNELYKEVPGIQRYVLEPPEGPIGGHCVVPNAEILDEVYPSVFTQMVKEGGKE